MTTICYLQGLAAEPSKQWYELHALKLEDWSVHFATFLDSHEGEVRTLVHRAYDGILQLVWEWRDSHTFSLCLYLSVCEDIMTALHLLREDDNLTALMGKLDLTT